MNFAPPPVRRVRADDPADSGSLVNPATIIVVCALGLTFLGLTILFSASAWFRDKQGVEVPYQYLTKQVIGVFAGAALCFVVSRLNLDYLRKYAWWIAGALLLLLVLVIIPHIGISVKGSRRWLGIGSWRVQISEFAKLGMVFCLAHYLVLNQSCIDEFKRGFLYPLGIIAAFAVPVLAEPDFGTAALMVAVGLVILFLAGARWRFIVPAFTLGLAAFGLLIAFNPNRVHRLLEFFSAEKSYHLRQGLIAFAAGGTDGAGLGQGRQQLNYLPEAHTDFIFSVVGEELGLWFTLAVVLAFTVIFIAGLVHLRRAPNLFQYLFVNGCLLLICVQAVINIGVVTGLLPTKGMSLPFISAGLSNLFLMGMLLGVFLNTQRTWGRVTLPRGAGLMREVWA